MRNFILRRLLQTIPMLLLASLLIFASSPWRPATLSTATSTLTAQRAAELRALYGLDQPLFSRYLHWLGRLLQGDLGFRCSIRSVSTLLNQYIWNSFLLAAVAMVLYWGIALAVG